MTSLNLTGTIAERLETLRATLPPRVKLIAVTKQVSVAAMREAYQAGVRDFGESRIQEATQKQAELQDLPDINWHLIGHLQSNKAKSALLLFQWIHSVDSLKLAQRLDSLAGELSCQPQVCLQVKIASDPNKFGFSVTELMESLPALNGCQHLQIRGLMSIPPLGLSEAETLKFFERTAELASKIEQQSWSHIHLQHLSMGMSEDYGLAIQAGSTFIRLGRALFGERT
ncbi:YggS family pyridoxal phosphate-dependent enzyme [Desertifilum sp. FACHB-1129]|uniref:Pyridoxal phosphate homeostasis protein n=2 Tax=Desertifilum tharense IPPAS B-1220 TaxID=1781255 RepID=A0A1E5QEA0_9CYAN|nr:MULTISPECIES: YggS family pyridoxal phosphate-dependent enzyme [Desertifilum]MDA0211521.1 YggS family pyridoxal phosphate-dependent enzyme [Cyanobacteria bacterium FC1]MBD2315029.1 YggS family pyridoxal phosphate-dependent enzyme [Desertifilum sp. FACHB-1129]MBD2324707.1 YggS family pyridoxal phosphate-dependent enzyme [Desertifilum sp. FACHB-866]MBD2334737.1 YggS family pyridoxal phosphate-dependent enzyme [Desertifilum sp. FACHB-868]OEJ72995.1 YggS family pyridoxal phosphate enzyme [Deser